MLYGTKLINAFQSQSKCMESNKKPDKNLTLINQKPIPTEEPSWKTPKRGLIVECFKGEVKCQSVFKNWAIAEFGSGGERKPFGSFRHWFVRLSFPFFFKKKQVMLKSLESSILTFMVMLKPTPFHSNAQMVTMHETIVK